MNDLNPSRFIELAEKVQQDAKAAAIALLRDKVENHVIDSDLIENADGDDYWLYAFDGDDIQIEIYAYGLNELGQLCFKARDYISGNDYEDGEWCEFDQYSISDKFHLVYEIIAKHVIAYVEQ